MFKVINDRILTIIRGGGTYINPTILFNARFGVGLIIKGSFIRIRGLVGLLGLAIVRKSRPSKDRSKAAPKRVLL